MHRKGRRESGHAAFADLRPHLLINAAIRL